MPLPPLLARLGSRIRAGLTALGPVEVEVQSPIGIGRRALLLMVEAELAERSGNRKRVAVSGALVDLFDASVTFRGGIAARWLEAFDGLVLEAGRFGLRVALGPALEVGAAAVDAVPREVLVGLKRALVAREQGRRLTLAEFLEADEPAREVRPGLRTDIAERRLLRRPVVTVEEAPAPIDAPDGDALNPVTSDAGVEPGPTSPAGAGTENE